jgi:hypothetical protein
LVSLVEREGGYLRPQTNLAGELEEVSSVYPSHVRYTPNLALAPEQAIVVELGYPVQVNGVDGNYSSLSQAGKGRYYDIATGRESDGAVKADGRFVRLTSHPHRPQRSCQPAMSCSAGGDVHLTIPGAQDRDCQMGGSTKPEQADTIAVLYARHTKAAKTDNAGAQQGGGM